MPFCPRRQVAKACSLPRFGWLWPAVAIMLAISPAAADFLDPPLGWDVWDPTWPHREIWEGEGQPEAVRWRIERHQTYIEKGVPEAYRGAVNPLSRIPSALEAGEALYGQHCAACHDAAGQGRGEAGLSLYPSPALLAHLVRLPSRADEYLLWTIAEGGNDLATDMPAFKDTLETAQIWQIITFMRAGFPTTGGKVDE